jgi:hypothetical protein
MTDTTDFERYASWSAVSLKALLGQGKPTDPQRNKMGVTGGKKH